MKRAIRARDIPSALALADAVVSGCRLSLSRAITLAEAHTPKYEELAKAMLTRLNEHHMKAISESPKSSKIARNSSFRTSISGPPGAGKSTFIDAVGMEYISRGHRVSVLAVDPSSKRTGGSILGDKTRMERLSAEPLAFVRPTPSRGALGGVARHTSDAISICESAGFDRTIVETVGVGQSEVTSDDMVDMFVLVLSPSGGDELQGIKRGITEVADVIVVNKSDGPTKDQARSTAAEYARAVRLLPERYRGWQVPVIRVSSVTGDGIEQFVDSAEEFKGFLEKSGELEKLRSDQRVLLLQSTFREILADWLDRTSGEESMMIKEKVRRGELLPLAGARELLDIIRMGEH